MFRIISFLFVGLLSVVTVQARPALDKPNVIIVYLDDAGYGDFGFTGNKDVKTPHLDKLADQGMQFTSFYSGSPACSASRYALMTGKSPSRSGFKRWVLAPDDAQYIRTEEQTLPEIFKKAGYSTGMIGKWHLGVPSEKNNHTPDSLPMAHGFDSWIGIPYSNDMKPSVLLRQKGDSKEYPSAELVEPRVKHDTLTQRYFDEAVRFVGRHKAEPFFLYLAPAMPHHPLAVSPAFKGKSKNKDLYDDVIQEIDACMGKLVRAVDGAGIGPNTLIIFSSDNGPWLIKGDQGGCALPFRDGKGSTFEGGVRVPGLFRWTGTIPARSKNDTVVSVLDILPSAAALTGQTPEPLGKLDGRNILPLLNPTLWPSDADLSDYALILTGKGTNKPMAVRWKNWKLHTDTFSQLWGSKITGHNSPKVSASAQSPLLYDLEKDIAETTSVAADHPDVVAGMKKRLDSFNKSL